MWYKILIYLFPLTLLLFEWGLRSALDVDSGGFIGPTLSAAGLTFLLPLVQPKELKIPIEGRNDVFVTTKKDMHFIPFVWFFILVSLFAWSSACYLSIKLIGPAFFSFPAHQVIGMVVYMISLVMSYVKGKL
ncbi:hypothetical protein N1030_12850 [Desulfovibrio mangrovi]|uniref:hypothetical protein n=1 Tax=Desulfovibrio mangrovi TaxID=2976983 RepID=UPI00224525B4|nr:hypothetical protein [Desulfovibrio mangrovi]UZP66490.1 hypothetical protein N1030_12850 [Desulfovibrio mangrovi]